MSTAVAGRFKGVEVAVTVSALVFMTAVGAFAQGGDTAYVPFVVNVNATVKAQQGEASVSTTVTGGAIKILAVPLSGKISVRYVADARGQLNAPTISGARGNITLRLPPQSYNNAEVALYSVNGKRVLRGKAAAAEAASAISRRNVAPGVYMLSVKGVNGSAFTSRLTHGGGDMNINVAFGSESVSPARQLGKSAAAGEWVITVSADRREDSTYTLNLTAGQHTTQNITLRSSGGGDPSVTTFVDSRDGKSYKQVTIGSQVWMAENLNYDFPVITSDVCYNNNAEYCAKYGRLYDWNTAMGGYPSSSANPSGVQGVCPAGWHLPSDAEWTVLTDYVGSNAGTRLKSTDGWSSNGNGTDDYLFSALPGGDGYSGGGGFLNAGSNGYWWSATQGDASFAWRRAMGYDYEGVGRGSYGKAYVFSVRCAQD